MDCRPVAPGGCVGGEMGMSSDPSMKNTDPFVSACVSRQGGNAHQTCAGSSKGITVLISPPDSIKARPAPPAPCECPNAPIWLTFSLLKKMLVESPLALIRNFAASRMVCPGPVMESSVAITTNPHDTMCFSKYATLADLPKLPFPQVSIGCLKPPAPR